MNNLVCTCAGTSDPKKCAYCLIQAGVTVPTTPSATDSTALSPPPCTCKDQATQPTGWCAQHKMGWVRGGVTPPPLPPGTKPAVRTVMPAQLVGWECPRCTAIMNPHYPACINCTGRQAPKPA